MPLTDDISSAPYLRHAAHRPGSTRFARITAAAVLLVAVLVATSPSVVAAGRSVPGGGNAVVLAGSGVTGPAASAVWGSQFASEEGWGSVQNDPIATAAATTRVFNLYYARAERYQDPDSTACTAASTLSMLNTIAHAKSASGFVWKVTTSLAKQTSILAFERAHMTMQATSKGSDPHGWRNALNYFGWGSLTAGVYVDRPYSTLAAAAKAAVSALATTRKPVGILALQGGHAQFITGYKVTGADPKTGSSNFTVVGIYLTDPWKTAGHRNFWVTYAQWNSGSKWLRFSPYAKSDSPNKDPIDGHVGKTEWLGKWVIIAPVK